MSTYTYKILMRNDTVSNWSLTGSTILDQGEIGVAFSGTTFDGMKIGDGTSTWDSLDYLYSDIYTKSEVDSNFLSTGTTITDLNGYSQAYLNLEFARLDTSGLTNYSLSSDLYSKTYIDTNFAPVFTGFTGHLNLSGQTGQVVINISNGIITSTGSTWI